MRPPLYFEAIRRNASNRWDQLERDPELAAPWHQLFRQVQSPRHVLSELLQNADDAGATQAVVRIRDGLFIFAHNGGDFAQEHFQSLCRFGFSNKRSLHTIGFRGIGFKSTFSIGDEVRLFTPSLSVSFSRDRFTQPDWTEPAALYAGWTEIHVAIKDEHRQRELEKNLQEWSRSPVSLLFFRSIRRLVIEQEEIHWVSAGPGPVAESEWMSLSTLPDRKYLLVRSPEEEFPQAALEEIRQERMASEQEMTFPPCRVELVLGIEGRLFVVLPTGVKTNLPFACSAPFVQDPARLKIKDPDISPTNRWLLKRIGELAARALLGWVGQEQLPLEQRAEAYKLWIDFERGDSSLESTCAGIARDSFGAVVKCAPCLLSEEGMLQAWFGCLAVPPTLLDVWSADQISALFDSGKRPVLSRYVADEARQRLVRWNALRLVSLTEVVNLLKAIHPPKPQTWTQLLSLWSLVSGEIVNPRFYWDRQKGLHILPVNGADVLYAPNEVVRLGERQVLASDDWAFLAKYLRVLDQTWTKYLSEHRRSADEQPAGELSTQVEVAYKILRELGLADASDVGQVMAQVTERFFGQETCLRSDTIRLAHIAAKLNAPVPQSFEYITRDGYRTPLTSQVALDGAGDLDLFVDETWYEDHVLHDDYARAFESCTEMEWRQWSTSPRSGLLTFVPFVPVEARIWGQKQVLVELSKRGLKGEPAFPYRNNEFTTEDWDFEAGIWEVWKRAATTDDGFWARVLTRIMKQPQSYWGKALPARILQVARSGSARSVTTEPLLPGWILKFRELPCLQDTWGRYCQPAELLRRTPETEALLDVEPFIRSEFDTEALRPLLVLLGVRDTPTGPGSLLERLRALSGLTVVPLNEVQKWYNRLDQLVDHCATEEFLAIKAAFQTSNLILTEGQGWVRSTEVFLGADEEDVPGAAVVHPSVRHLTLWLKLGVHERPTVDLAIEWLKSLPSGALAPDQLRRVRSLLSQYPDRVWHECGYWLTLEGDWVPVTNLAYALTMQSLVPWKHLFPAVKARTADLLKLSTDVCERHPFSSLPRLGSAIEDRFAEKPGGVRTSGTKPWMVELGHGLERILLDDPLETERIRALGKRMAQTRWQATTGLETVPYLGGLPAGTARQSDALWRDSVLYVEDRSAAKMAVAVPRELGRVFNRLEITDALKLCYERSAEFVAEYLETNFSLAAMDKIAEAKPVSEGRPNETGPTGPLSVKPGQMQTGETPVHPAGPDPQQVSTPSETPGSLASPDTPVAAGTPDVPETPAIPGTLVAPNGQPPQGPDSSGGSQEPPEPPALPSKEVKPQQRSLIERFAGVMGFIRDGSDRFYHQDGSSLAKIPDSPFPWERRSATGQTLQRYWLKEHCLERGSLQVDSEVWFLCEKSPERYSFILTDPEGNPCLHSGQQLLKLRDGGQLAIYPATYRLVIKHDAVPEQ